MLWLKDEQGEARRRWKDGNEMGFTMLSEEEVVLNRLSSVENPDCRNWRWRLVFMMMSLISLNIRGLGGNIKRTYERELIRKVEVGIVCLQETKCSMFSKESCFYLWG